VWYSGRRADNAGRGDDVDPVDFVDFEHDRE
jgi:hypothetical protein